MHSSIAFVPIGRGVPPQHSQKHQQRENVIPKESQLEKIICKVLSSDDNHDDSFQQQQYQKEEQEQSDHHDDDDDKQIQIPYLMEVEELEQKSKHLLDELVGPLFHNNKKQTQTTTTTPTISQNTLQGAAVAGASLSILAGSNLAVASAAGIGAAYVASKPGMMGGDAVRMVGEYTWNSTANVLSQFYHHDDEKKKKKRKEEEEEVLIRSILKQVPPKKTTTTTEKKRVVGELDLNDVERVLAEANAALMEANREVEKTQQLLLQNSTTTAAAAVSSTTSDNTPATSTNFDLKTSGAGEEDEEKKMDVETIIAEAETALLEANKALLLEEKEKKEQYAASNDNVETILVKKAKETFQHVHTDKQFLPSNGNDASKQEAGVSATQAAAAGGLPFFAQEKKATKSLEDNFYFAKTENEEVNQGEVSSFISTTTAAAKMAEDEQTKEEVLSKALNGKEDELTVLVSRLASNALPKINKDDTKRKEAELIQEFQRQVENGDSCGAKPCENDYISVKNGVPISSNGNIPSDARTTTTAKDARWVQRELTLAKEAVTVVWKEQFQTKDKHVVTKGNRKKKKKKGKRKQAFGSSFHKIHGREESYRNNKMTTMEKGKESDIVSNNEEEEEDRKTLSWVDYLQEKKEKGMNY